MGDFSVHLIAKGSNTGKPVVYCRGTQTFFVPVHIHYFTIHWGPQANIDSL